MEERTHKPVLLNEVLEYIGRKKEGVFIDCTLGMGGHAKEILKKNPKSSLIGLDLDERSLMEAKKTLSPFLDRVSLYHSDFRYIPHLNLDFQKISGILVDLGISSFQLDSPERGFSYNHDGPLDMRMDFRSKYSAFKIINKSPESHLNKIFFEYGELRQARRLAREIASRRKINKIETTAQLRRIIEEVCRWRPQKGKIHPAAKLFLALRIEVNQELKGLADFLEKTIQKLQAGTRIVVISFHSLEDRIIKKTFVRMASSEDCPPCLKILTKKPVTASPQEVDSNFRSRSAKLRAAEVIN